MQTKSQTFLRNQKYNQKMQILNLEEQNGELLGIYQ